MDLALVSYIVLKNKTKNSCSFYFLFFFVSPSFYRFHRCNGLWYHWSEWPCHICNTDHSRFVKTHFHHISAVWTCDSIKKKMLYLFWHNVDLSLSPFYICPCGNRYGLSKTCLHFDLLPCSTRIYVFAR